MKLKEIFNKSIPTKNGGHIDVWEEPKKKKPKKDKKSHIASELLRIAKLLAT